MAQKRMRIAHNFAALTSLYVYVSWLLPRSERSILLHPFSCRVCLWFLSFFFFFRSFWALTPNPLGLFLSIAAFGDYKAKLFFRVAVSSFLVFFFFRLSAVRKVENLRYVCPARRVAGFQPFPIGFSPFPLKQQRETCPFPALLDVVQAIRREKQNQQSRKKKKKTTKLLLADATARRSGC